MPDSRHAPLPLDRAQAAAVRRAIVGRCAALGIPAFVSAEDHHLNFAVGMDDVMAGLFLGSPAVAAHVAGAWSAEGAGAGDLRQAFPGAWLLTLAPDAAALLLADTAAGSEKFADLCRVARLDPAAVAHGLLPHLLCGPGEVDRTARALRLAADDIRRAERTDRTVGQLTEKLAQTYEETNLLFRLPRFLNDDAGPAAAVRRIVDELADVLPFGWLAVQFRRDLQDVPDLAGRLFVAGELPVDRAAFARLAAPLLEGERSGGLRISAVGDRGRLLTPADGGLAAAAGGEVLAEPVLHGGDAGGAVAVLLAGGKGGADPDISSAEAQFVDAAAGLLGIFHENLGRFSEVRGLFLGTLKALTASIDAKDAYTRGHSERVALLAATFAAALGHDPKTVDRYRIAGLVHDVGKIGVPESVLAKAGRPTDAEFDQIKKHPEIGTRILESIGNLADVLPGVLHHHERWDGRGYPHRLAAEGIPPMARVMALADTFDAMSSTRSYRAALPRAAVLAELTKCAGAQFDPDLVERFVALDFSEYDRLLRDHAAGGRAADDAEAAAPERQAA